jgi:hypothetical protein
LTTDDDNNNIIIRNVTSEDIPDIVELQNNLFRRFPCVIYKARSMDYRHRSPIPDPMQPGAC